MTLQHQPTCPASEKHFTEFHQGGDLSSWTVLLVDDNPAVRNLIRELFLRQRDFTVCGEAQDGREAILKAQELKPDLIVTDLSMPFMNGLEEINQLRELMPSVPIILYSADMDRFVEKEGFAVGASAVVAKPNVVEQLIPTARSLLAGPAV